MRVVVGDFHVPYHSDNCLNLLLKFGKKHRISEIVLGGDFMDFYAISSFNRNPDRINALQKEVDLGIDILKKLKSITKNIIYVQGNHEERLRKYLWTKAPELASLRSLKFETLMKLKKLDITYIEDQIVLDGVLITHGDMTSKYSSYTARGMFEKVGTTLIFGHTHKGGVYYKTDTRGTNVSYENFCMCSLEPEWIRNPNWQQGFSVLTDGYVQQIYIKDGKKLMYGNKVIKQ